MHIRFRIKLLNKIAQNAEIDQVFSTDTVQKENKNVGTPPDFNVRSFYPEIDVAWGTSNAQKIQNIAALLNSSLFYLSKGVTSLKHLRDQNFVVSETVVPQLNAKRVMSLCQSFRNCMLTAKGEPYSKALTKDQVGKLKEIFINSDAFKILPEGDIDPILKEKNLTNLKGRIRDLASGIGFAQTAPTTPTI